MRRDILQVLLIWHIQSRLEAWRFRACFAEDRGHDHRHPMQHVKEGQQTEAASEQYYVGQLGQVEYP